MHAPSIICTDKDLGFNEIKDAWSTFFEEMTGRGLRQPPVSRNFCAVSDGAKGLMAAIEEHLPQADR